MVLVSLTAVDLVGLSQNLLEGASASPQEVAVGCGRPAVIVGVPMKDTGYA